MGAASSSPFQDGRVVRSLWLLSEGDLEKFLDYRRPSRKMCDYLRRASRPQLNGLLIETLRYWHQSEEAT